MSQVCSSARINANPPATAMGSPGSKTATGTIVSMSTAEQMLFQGIAPCTIFAELRQEFAEEDRIHMLGVTQEMPPAV